MFTFGYTSRKSRALKAVTVLVIGLLLLRTRIGFWILIGGLFVFIGARDLWVVCRESLAVRKAEEQKAKRPQKEERPAAPEEGKIQITDLSDAKEVDFTKE